MANKLIGAHFVRLDMLSLHWVVIPIRWGRAGAETEPSELVIGCECATFEA